MKIANKISISFLIAGLILTSIAGTIFYIIAKNNLEKSIYNSLSATVASRSKHIETYLKMLEISIGQLSKSTVLENFLKIKSGEALEIAMKRLKRTKEANSAIAEFLLLDKTGKVLVSSNESSIGQDESTDTLFLGAQKEVHIKDVYYSEALKEPLIAVSSPFLDSQTGEFLGVLAARVRLNELNNIVLEKTGLGDMGEIYIINKSGFMITPSRFKKDAVLKQKVDTQNARVALLHKAKEHALPQDKRIDIFPDYRGVQVLGVHEYLPQMQWAVLVEIDLKEVLAPLAQLRLVFFLILLIVPIAAWLLGMFLAMLITAPLHRLHKGTEIIGSGNLDYKVGTKAKDEIGQLSRAFDKMTENLKKTTTSVENLNKETDQRKEVEIKLRDSEEWLSVTLGSIGDGVIATDTAGCVTFLNKVAENLTGWSQKDAKGRTLADIFRIFNEQTQEKLDSPAEKVLKTKAIVGLGNHTALIAKDGTQRPIDDSAAPIKNMEGKIIGVVLIFRDVTARRKVENELRRLAAIIDFSDDAIIGKNLDGTIFSWNKGAEKIYGYKPGEIIGKNISILTPPEHKSETPEILEKIKRGERIEHFETTRMAKDGRRVDVSLIVSAIIDNLGRIIGASAISHDITERKKAEELVRDSEEKFHQLFESSRDAIMTLDRNGFIDCNNKTLELFGIKQKADFIKKHPSELSPNLQLDGSDSLSAANKHIEHAFKQGVDFFEWVHKKADGSVFPAEVLLSRFRIEGKEYLQATVRDITGRKEAQRQIEQGLEEWERTFNSIADFIFIQDKDYNIVRVNNAFCQALKVKPGEVIGRKCYEVMHKLDHPWPSCPFEKTKYDHIAHSEEVDDPSIGIPLLVSVSPIFDSKREFAGAVHIAKDISERKKVENALREAVEMKTNFASTVSHELRTPLAAIKEGISIVLDGTSGEINKEQNEFLDIAKKNVDRLARLINNILDFQKLDSGKTIFDIKANNINETIKEIKQTMLSVAQQKNLDFILELDASLPLVQFDKDRIVQVLVNLVNNAVKFTEKGSVKIQTSSLDDSIRVSIKDTGIGIKQEDISRLFNRFEQLDAGMTRKTGGTGLGLSICKEIIEKHNGKIWVESKFGEGSIFNFDLPIIAKSS